MASLPSGYSSNDEKPETKEPEVELKVELEKDKKVSEKLAPLSPFAKLPNLEFVEIMGYHGVGFTKEHCEWLRDNRRFNLFYQRANELGLQVIPNEETRIRKLKEKENLVYVVEFTKGKDGYLKLLEFAQEFSYKGQDARNYVV